MSTVNEMALIPRMRFRRRGIPRVWVGFDCIILRVVTPLITCLLFEKTCSKILEFNFRPQIIVKRSSSRRPHCLNRGLCKYDCGYVSPASTDWNRGLVKTASLVKPATSFIGLKGSQGQFVNPRSETNTRTRRFDDYRWSDVLSPLLLCTWGLTVIPQGWGFLVLPQTLCNQSNILK